MIPPLALVLVSVAWLAPAAGPHRQSAIASLRDELTQAERALASGAIEDAARRYEDALGAAEQLGGETLLLARAIDGLADARRLAGRLPEAEELYRRSAPLLARLLGEKQPRLAVTLHNLAAVCLSDNRPADALPHLRRALAIWETTRGSRSAEAAMTRELLDRISARQTE